MFKAERDLMPAKVPMDCSPKDMRKPLFQSINKYHPDLSSSYGVKYSSDFMGKTKECMDIWESRPIDATKHLDYPIDLNEKQTEQTSTTHTFLRSTHRQHLLLLMLVTLSSQKYKNYSNMQF
jgi:hypothetical protein